MTPFVLLQLHIPLTLLVASGLHVPVTLTVLVVYVPDVALLCMLRSSTCALLRIRLAHALTWHMLNARLVRSVLLVFRNATAVLVAASVVVVLAVGVVSVVVGSTVVGLIVRVMFNVTVMNWPWWLALVLTWTTPSTLRFLFTGVVVRCVCFSFNRRGATDAAVRTRGWCFGWDVGFGKGFPCVVMCTGWVLAG